MRELDDEIESLKDCYDGIIECLKLGSTDGYYYEVEELMSCIHSAIGGLESIKQKVDAMEEIVRNNIS